MTTRVMTKTRKSHQWRWQCLECGKTFRTPPKDRCPDCRGTDFDIDASSPALAAPASSAATDFNQEATDPFGGPRPW